METKTQNKTTGKETIVGREVSFTWENADGENPKTIEVAAQAVKEGKSESISGSYSLEANTFSRLQLFNLPLADNTDVVAGIVTAIETIVESFNTPA